MDIKTEPKPQSKEIEVIQIAKEVENRIRLPTGEILTLEEYLVWLGNLILEMKKALY